MEPVVKIPMEPKTLQELTEKAKDYALMHGRLNHIGDNQLMSKTYVTANMTVIRSPLGHFFVPLNRESALGLGSGKSHDSLENMRKLKRDGSNTCNPNFLRGKGQGGSGSGRNGNPGVSLI